MAETPNTSGGGGNGGTGAGPTRMGVYDQPERPKANPLAKLLPLLIGLAVLAALAYYFLLRPRGTEPADTGQTSATMSGGPSSDASNATSPPGSRGGTRANPPGPSGAR